MALKAVWGKSKRTQKYHWSVLCKCNAGLLQMKGFCSWEKHIKTNQHKGLKPWHLRFRAHPYSQDILVEHFQTKPTRSSWALCWPRHDRRTVRYVFSRIGTVSRDPGPKVVQIPAPPSPVSHYITSRNVEPPPCIYIMPLIIPYWCQGPPAQRGGTVWHSMPPDSLEVKSNHLWQRRTWTVSSVRSRRFDSDSHSQRCMELRMV
ncbi:hypothetical protein B0H14DRAFT_2770655 [Mycena olivaceomarginata]|nr:hypothetical protein B0H14DRAFT_2770655 [Mycena olivaceomarginata]